VGAVYLPAMGEMYWADEGGAFRNGERLSPRPLPSLEDPLAFLAVPSNAHRRYEIDLPRLRSLGSTAAHLVYVAASSCVGALTRWVSIWDVAGALPFFPHAGVAARYLSGAPFVVAPLLDGVSFPEPLLVARADLMEEIRRRIRPKG
jgi:fructose-1,6-bisphosphatase/inositol monophosphatase family enzyme